MALWISRHIWLSSVLRHAIYIRGFYLLIYFHQLLFFFSKKQILVHLWITFRRWFRALKATVWVWKGWLFLLLAPDVKLDEVLILTTPFLDWDNGNIRKKKSNLTVVWVLKNCVLQKNTQRETICETEHLFCWIEPWWTEIPIIISFVPWNSFLCSFQKNSSRSVHLSTQAYQSSSTLSLYLKIKKLIKKQGWIRICISDQKSFESFLLL